MRSLAAAVNWLWLAETPSRERALVVASGEIDWRAALGRHFERVDLHSIAALRTALYTNVGRHVQRPVLPFDDRTFDLAFLPGFVGNWHRLARLLPRGAIRAAMLAECRRILRPGGVLVVSGRNPQWYGGAQERGPLPACATVADDTGAVHSEYVNTHFSMPSLIDARLPAGLRRAGFADVRAYFADPSDLVPRAIVPAVRGAVLAYERQEQSLRGRAPRLLATVGLQALAYPARFFVAIA